MIADLIWELEQAFDGDPWHGPSFLKALEGVGAELASRRPPGGAHTIGEIVRHVESWQREVARRVAEGDWREPEMGDWPEPLADWSAALAALRDSQRVLIEAIRAMGDGRLALRLDVERNPALGTGYTYAVMLHGQAQHLAYHGGQIAVLKRVVV